MCEDEKGWGGLRLGGRACRLSLRKARLTIFIFLLNLEISARAGVLASLRVHVETINNRGLLAIPAWEHTGSAQTQLFQIINFLSKALHFPIWESICLQNDGNHIQVTSRKEVESEQEKKM